jgi:MFS family permease
MTDPIAADGPGLSERSGAEDERNLGRRILFIVVGIAALVISYLVGAAVVPRWWAQRIGNVVDGSLVAGNTLGFSIGFVFTLLPIFVLYLGWRFKKSWKRALGFMIGAFAIGAPNLMTLGIVVGSGNAAHAGERILDVDGPGFRGGSLVGAVAAVIAGLVLVWLVSSRRRNKKKASDLKHELDARD